MVYIGNKYIQLVTNKDASRGRESTVRNYTGYSPTVDENDPTLESGSLSFMLHSRDHPENWSPEEQKNALEHLVLTNTAENPFVFLEDKGFIQVDSVEFTRSPALEHIEAEISYRALDYDDYIPAIRYEVELRDHDFNVGSSHLFPLPYDNIKDAEYRDGDAYPWRNGDNYLLVPAHGDMIEFVGSEGDYIFEYTFEEDGYPSAEWDADIRCYNDRGERVFSKNSSLVNGRVSNGLIRLDFGNNDLYGVERSTGDWIYMGNLEAGFSRPVIDYMDSYKLRVKNTVDGETFTMYRGRSWLDFDVDTYDELQLNITDADEPVDGGESVYGHAGRFWYNSGSDFEYFVTRTRNEGNLVRQEGAEEKIGMDQIPDGTDMRICIGQKTTLATRRATVSWSFREPEITRMLVDREDIQ